MNKMIINDIDISIKEYQGQRVITFKDIDTTHKRPDNTARRNFSQHKERFIEGEDYFKVRADEIRTHKIMEISNRTHEDITLITESGYLMLVKSFTDDLSWEVQRALVNTYFRVQNTVPQKPPIVPRKYIPQTYNGMPVITISDITYIFNKSHATIFNAVKSLLKPDEDYVNLSGINLKMFFDENPQSPKCKNSLCVIFSKGFFKLVEHFGFNPENIPDHIKHDKANYLVQQATRNVMEYIRKELKGVEALTYLLESCDTPYNLENYRNALVRKLSAIKWWMMDAQTVKLGIHKATLSEFMCIQKGEYGIK